MVGRTDHGSPPASPLAGERPRGSPGSRTWSSPPGAPATSVRPASAHPALRPSASAPVSVRHHHATTTMRSGSRGNVARPIEASPLTRKPRAAHDKAPWSSQKPGSLFTNGPIGSEPTLFAVTGSIADLSSPKPREPMRHPGYPTHTEARPPETRQEAGKSNLELGGSRKLEAEGGRYFLVARENETPRHFARLLGVPLEDVLRVMEMSDHLRFKVKPNPNPNPNQVVDSEPEEGRRAVRALQVRSGDERGPAVVRVGRHEAQRLPRVVVPHACQVHQQGRKTSGLVRVARLI